MRNPLFRSTLPRLRVTPDDPFTLPGRPRSSRRPHSDARVEIVRRLIETTTLTYAEISAKTGVGRASICRWTRDRNWQRPVFAPRATDTVPRARASMRLKRRLLAGRLQAIAERYVQALEETPGVDLEKLAQALMLMRMIKLAAKPKRRRTGTIRGRTALDYEDVPVLMNRLRAAGVDTDIAPREAMTLFLDSHRAPDDERHFRERGGKSRRAQAHRRMFDWERD